MSKTKTCICRVINNPLYPRNSSYTLLHYICANSLGTIVDFIFKMSDTIDVFNIEDDDGNTPLHILCKRMDELEANTNDLISRYGSPSLELQNFTSFPSSSIIYLILKYLSDYINLSIKNKKNIAPVDLTSNIFIHNLCYSQMVRKTYKPKLSINDPYKVDWNALFNLRDSKIKNRTLLHHLCKGDRLNAIRFLIENGANINVISRTNEIQKPIDRLFSTKYIIIPDSNNVQVSVKVPSGFRNMPKTKTGNIKDITLERNEELMLRETEDIAEYLVEHGADLNPDTFCDYSDIMYRLIKRKTENPGKKPLLQRFSSIVKEVTNELMKYSCFPFSTYAPIDFIDNKITKKVKFIRIPSNINENSDSK